ncbi:MAG: UDP-forming cellulose synthase catalytic subunit [Pseudomonadota bacterium]|jgi:cellulose synthase (UDP-forming)
MTSRHERWAQALGVEKPDSLRCWLWRFFVLPPDQAEPAPTWRGGLSRRTRGAMVSSPAGLALMQILGLLSWPWRQLQARWEQYDFSPWGPRLEALAESPLLRTRSVRWALGLIGLGVFWLTTTTPLEFGSQMLFFLSLFWLGLLLRRIPGRLPTLVMIVLSVVASCRYGYWRITQSMDLDAGWESWIGHVLMGAELYAWVILLLGFAQTIWPLQRPVLELPPDSDDQRWPSVDVYVPTYNEPLSVVGPTVQAALDIDWPADRLNVYLLDDGRRPFMREYAERVGATYLIRSDNRHAKAGNLNAAMKITQGEYIAIFDCDHMPVRSFLRATMGWMVRDPRCALIQTPHHFFSADPFERNLDTFRRVPNEGELFYGVVQDGNDFWDATFFCGSCAVLRRSAVMEVNGIAVETVTEDAHTALKLHRRGWRTAYLNRTLAAGLATESLSGHVGQRVRWARGMAQIFRVDNPFLGPGLNFMQRLCYANAMLHFFYGIPRMIFLTAPLAYLYFGMHIIRAEALVLVMYLLPHLVLPHITNAHMAGRHRHSFWSDLYETVLAWYVAVPTTLALINPKLGKFNVTAKGGLIEKTHLDWRISLPYFFLVGLNVIGLGMACWRFTRPAIDHPATVVLNVLWTLHNLLTLGAAIGVARERRQVRSAHRVGASLPAGLRLADGRELSCNAEDYSLQGMGVRVDVGQTLPELRPGDQVELLLGAPGQPDAYGNAEPPSLVATVASMRERFIGLRYEALNLSQERALMRFTFTRDDAWQHWHLSATRDRALDGLVEIGRLGVQTYADLAREAWQYTRNWVRRRRGRAV